MASNAELPVAETPECTNLTLDENTKQRVLGTIFGHCTGDAIGLLTEFLTKQEAKEHYKSVARHLEYGHKTMLRDLHRSGWEVGDWTDDTDQMLLILLSIIENKGKVDAVDFAKRLRKWALEGFRELGDRVGVGIGTTTSIVVHNKQFLADPHAVAIGVFERKPNLASNGAVMRTSILGVHGYTDLEAVKQNALAIGKTTHANPRCQASVVAVSVAIAMMLQRKPRHVDKRGKFKVKNLIDDTFELATKCLESEEQKKEFLTYLKCTNIKDLKLDEERCIGYTYKTMGCGFWALKQDNFRNTIQKIVMQGGDADTNACVAGAMLGCKLGCDAIPASWKDKLLHKDWLDNIIQSFAGTFKWWWDYIIAAIGIAMLVEAGCFWWGHPNQTGRQ